jgi:hypothetical protein
MDHPSRTIQLPTGISIEDAREAYYKLADQYHPNNVSDAPAKRHWGIEIQALDAVWRAVQDHSFEKDKTPEAKRSYEWYYSDV